MSRRAHVFLAGLGVAIALLALGAPAAPAAAADRKPVDRVLVLSIPMVTWDDLDLADLPNLRRLLEQSALADMSARGVNRHATLADGYETISAGTRAVGRADGGECLNNPEPFEDGTARAAAARRLGVPITGIPARAIVCLGQPAIVARNDKLLFEAEPGKLAETLSDAGIARAAIGNADHGSPQIHGYFRAVALSVADEDGIVPAGDVTRGLNIDDTDAPYGVRADPDAYTRAFDRVWGDERTVVVVEASDLVRYETYRRLVAGDARNRMKERLLRNFDDIVGQLLERVDPERDSVLIVGTTQAAGPLRLTLSALRAPGIEPGMMQSGWTRREGIVSIVDVGPSIVDQFGLAQPDEMEGRPFERVGEGGSLDDRYDWLVRTDEASVFRDRMIPKVTTWFVILQVVLTGVAVLAFVRFPRMLTAVEISALALLAFLPATYVAGLISFHDLPEILYWAFLWGFAFTVAIIAWRVTDRRGVDPLIITLGVMLGVLAVDIVLGGRLQFNTALGYSPTIAGRFAGYGNLAYSQLAVGTALLAGLVAYRIPGRRGVYIAIGLLATAIVLDGAPMWGSDVGGVLSMVPAYALISALLLGWKIRWRSDALFGVATLVLISLFAAVDMTRPSDSRTHLGRFVEHSFDGGWDSFSTVILRKLDANISILSSSVWTRMLPLVLAGLFYLVYRAPGRLRGIQERIPPLRASLAGVAVVMVLGFALNDSGIAIPGVMLGVVTPVLIVITVRGDRVEPRPRAVPEDVAA